MSKSASLLQLPVFSGCATFSGIFIKTEVSFCAAFLAMITTSLVTFLLLSNFMQQPFLRRYQFLSYYIKLPKFYWIRRFNTKPATWPYHEPNQSSPVLQPTINTHFNIIPPLSPYTPHALPISFFHISSAFIFLSHSHTTKTWAVFFWISTTIAPLEVGPTFQEGLLVDKLPTSSTSSSFNCRRFRGFLHSDVEVLSELHVVQNCRPWTKSTILTTIRHM